MELNIKIKQKKKLKHYISLFLALFFINNLKATGSETKLNHLSFLPKNDKFESLDFNSTPYSEYDNYKNQLKTFFGFHPADSENSSYPDASIINQSNILREIYRSKLKDMTINKIIYKIEK